LKEEEWEKGEEVDTDKPLPVIAFDSSALLGASCSLAPSISWELPSSSDRHDNNRLGVLGRFGFLAEPAPSVKRAWPGLLLVFLVLLIVILLLLPLLLLVLLLVLLSIASDKRVLLGEMFGRSTRGDRNASFRELSAFAESVRARCGVW
jgi:hypothetical protein